MSARTACLTDEVVQAPRRPRGTLSWSALRFALCVSLAACLAVVLPTAGTSVANAAPVATYHAGGHSHGRGFGPAPAPAPGRGIGRFGPHQRMSLSGTAQSVTTTGFQLELSGPASGGGPGHGRLPFFGRSPRFLTSTSTTVDVAVTENTVYIAPGQSSPGAGDLLDGDSVQVTGVSSGPSAVTALLVRIPLVTVKGKAGSVGSTGFQVTVGGRRGVGGWGFPPSLTSTSTTLTSLTSTSTTFTVTLGDNVQYREPGQSSAGLSGIQDGDTVQVNGAQGGSGALTALVVWVPLANYSGTVSNVSGSGFDLSTKQGTVTVNVSSPTKYYQRRVSSPTVQNGDKVTVTGTQAGALAVDALLVVIRSGPQSTPETGGGPGFGDGHHGRR